MACSRTEWVSEQSVCGEKGIVSRVRYAVVCTLECFVSTVASRYYVRYLVARHPSKFAHSVVHCRVDTNVDVEACGCVASGIRCGAVVQRSKGRKLPGRVESRGVRRVGLGLEDLDGKAHCDMITMTRMIKWYFFLFWPCKCPWLRLNKLGRNGSMQSVRERPSDPWIGMVGWAGQAVLGL